MAYTTNVKVRIATGLRLEENISNQVIDDAIRQAESLIDSKIGKVYQLPLVEVPYIIEYIALSLSQCFLFTQTYGNETQLTDKGWQRLLDSMMTLLDSYVNQESILTDSNGVQLPQTGFTEMSGIPNATTNADRRNSTLPKITINKQW